MADFIEYNDTLWVLHTYSNNSNKIDPEDELLYNSPICNGLSMRYNSTSEAILLFNCYGFSEDCKSINEVITKISSKIESIAETGGWLQIVTTSAVYLFHQLDTTIDDMFNFEEESDEYEQEYE